MRFSPRCQIVPISAKPRGAPSPSTWVASSTDSDPWWSSVSLRCARSASGAASAGSSLIASHQPCQDSGRAVREAALLLPLDQRLPQPGQRGMGNRGGGDHSGDPRRGPSRPPGRSTVASTRVMRCSASGLPSQCRAVVLTAASAGQAGSTEVVRQP